MSIDGITGASTAWHWRQAAAASGSGSVGTRAQPGGTVAGGSPSFMQALSGDLQAMLTQRGSTPSDKSGSASRQVAANRALAGTHQPQHHQGSAGGDAALRSVANRVTGC